MPKKPAAPSFSEEGKRGGELKKRGGPLIFSFREGQKIPPRNQGLGRGGGLTLSCKKGKREEM